MAKAKTPANTGGREVVDWEKQMEEQAAVAAAAQRSTGGGGKFFSMKAGQLSFDGNPFPGNQMAVIVLAYTLENSWYDGPYDPNTPASPRCFAFGMDEKTLEPHPKVDEEEYFERQNDECSGCPRNEWGSADTGRGKACKNVVRLAMIPAGEYVSKGGRNAGLDLTLYDDPEHFAKADVAFMKLPVMSVANWTKFVKQVAADLRRPPHGIIVNLVVVPDAKAQFKVEFEVIDNVPNELLPVIMQRHGAEQASIDFPYSPPMEDEAPTPNKASSKLTKRPAAKKPAAKSKR